MENGLRFTGAILSIVFGGFYVVIGLICLVIAPLVGVICLAIAIPLVVLGSLLCREQNNNGIAIALLAITSLLCIADIIEGVNQSKVATVIGGILVFGTIAGFLIAYLCVRGSSARCSVPSDYDDFKMTEDIMGGSSAPTANEKAQAAAAGDLQIKINALKKLKESGEISDEEYKKLLFALIGK